MSQPNPTPNPTQSSHQGSESDSDPAGLDDVVSDPAKGAEDRSDWSDEGGATTDGPADD